MISNFHVRGAPILVLFKYIMEISSVLIFCGYVNISFTPCVSLPSEYILL